MSNVDTLIQQSLVYERCYSRICQILNTTVSEKKADEEEKKSLGEPKDESFDILIGDLNALKDAYRDKADKIFAEAEKASDKFQFGYDNLFNAIALRAAQDYEEALCGEGSESEKRMIEMFLPEKITGKIREAQPEFVKLAQKNVNTIVMETKRERKRKHTREGFELSIRCPLCGGGMYAYNLQNNGLYKIKCTGCSMFCSAKEMNNDS